MGNKGASMRWVRFSVVLLIVTLLNTVNLLSVGSLDIRPDLLLIFLLFCVSNCEGYDAIIASFAIGFAADISGVYPTMGPYVISFGLFGSMISQARRVLIMKRPVYQAFAIFFTGLFAGGLAQALIFFRTGQAAVNPVMVLLATAFYSALLGPFVWLLFSAISRWLGLGPNRYQRSMNR